VENGYFFSCKIGEEKKREGVRQFFALNLSQPWGIYSQCSVRSSGTLEENKGEKEKKEGIALLAGNGQWVHGGWVFIPSPLARVFVLNHAPPYELLHMEGWHWPFFVMGDAFCFFLEFDHGGGRAKGARPEYVCTMA
jgi:hypothetical protein